MKKMIVIIVAALFAMTLSGCASQSIVGTWVDEDGDELTFCADGTIEDSPLYEKWERYDEKPSGEVDGKTGDLYTVYPSEEFAGSSDEVLYEALTERAFVSGDEMIMVSYLEASADAWDGMDYYYRVK